ncbi:MAG TPA: hypothetical protein VHU83_06655 [Bryobacteraceae bacterium]|jgi:hypothetical protein|nr:hypothetical protein [Bryobacteraceae bacterium]
MASTVTLADTIDWALPFLRFAPVTIGTSNEPAITSANTILQTILAAPFKWRWNRKTLSINTVPGQQDYTLNVNDMGFMELADISLGASTLPGLQFGSSQTSISPFNVQPSSLITLNEQFASDQGQFTRYTENVMGSYSISGGQMTVTHANSPTDENDIFVETSQTVSMPQFFTSIQIDNNGTGVGNYDNGGVGIAKDANNFLWASLDRKGGNLRIQIKIAGTSTYLASVAWSVPNAPYQLGLSLVSNSACVWANTGSGWVYVTGADASSYYDFRTVGNLTGWAPGFTVASQLASTWVYSNFLFGSYGTVGLRDITLVTNQDGTPYAQGSVFTFTATAADPRAAAYCTVFQYNVTTSALAQTGVIFVNRAGKIYNDGAAHIIYYSNGARRLTISSWGNPYPPGPIFVASALINSEILTGAVVVSGLTQLSLAGTAGASSVYDPFLINDGTKWIMAYTVSQTLTPGYPVAAYSYDLVTWTMIGQDTASVGYEGTKIINYNGTYYLTCNGPYGAGANVPRVYLLESMQYVGTLNITIPAQNVTVPHMMAFYYNNVEYVITFDTTQYNSTAWTWGNWIVYGANAPASSFSTTGSNIFPLEIAETLSRGSEQGRPTFIALQTDDDAGNLTFRVLPAPDQSYSISVTYQVKAPLFSSLSQTWAPVPDFMEYIYNWGFLSLMLDYNDSSKAQRMRQLFVASLLGASEGLSEADKNLFTYAWLGDMRQQQAGQLSTQLGNQGRAI